MEAERIPIHTPFIKLDALLKFAGFCTTGAEAKSRILSGDVLLNGDPCLIRGKKLYPGDCITADGKTVVVIDENQKN